MEDRRFIIERLKSICSEYADILGMVILFGSISRGEGTDSSDIDLYVESKELKMTTDKLCTSKRYKDFRRDLSSNFEKSLDVLAYGGKRDTGLIRKSTLWKQIEKDGVLIYDQRAKAV